jgi:hypothetical protein
MHYYEGTLNIARNAAGLAIKAGGSADANYANSVGYTINGKLYMQTTQDVDLTGIDLLEGEHTIVSVWLDENKAVSVTAGNIIAGYDGTTLTPYETKDIDLSLNRTHALIGTIYILGLGGAFTGGTTALDAVTLLVIYSDRFDSIGM